MIIEIILVIIVIAILIKVIIWVYSKSRISYYHYKNPNNPKLDRNKLKGYLINSYGKKEGNTIFKDIVKILEKKGIK